MAVEAVNRLKELERSFAKECAELFDPIFRYVRASVRSSQDAEDLTQDVFARALAMRHRFVGGDLGAWLYRMARNRVAMHYRRADVEARGKQVLELGASSAATVDPEQTAAVAESREAMYQAIEELQPLEQEAIRLKFSKSFQNVQIAEMLGVTPGHLGVLLHRALRKLRIALEGQGHE